MPTAICKTCGRLTNSTASNYWTSNQGTKFGEVSECYAAWDEEKNGWIQGCAYKKLSGHYKKWIDSLIDKPSEQPPESLERRG